MRGFFSRSFGVWHREIRFQDHVLSFEFLVVSLVFELRLQSLQGPILFDEFVAKTCDLVLRVSPHLIQSGLEHIDPGGKTEILVVNVVIGLHLQIDGHLGAMISVVGFLKVAIATLVVGGQGRGVFVVLLLLLVVGGVVLVSSWRSSSRRR